MKIQEATVELAASHVASRSRSVIRESELSFGQLFQGLASDEAGTETIQLEQVKKMLEALIDAILAAMDGRQTRTKIAADQDGGAESNRPHRQIHWRNVVHERICESESTQVCGKGLVKTSDGREIDFAFQLDMARSFSRENRSEESGSIELRDPLVLNFDGSYCQLTDQRFKFDLDSDGKPEYLPGLADGNCFLVFDRNGNGRADDGSELFGTRSGDGFADLARLDHDGNGWIDEGDSAYASLGLWSGDSYRSLGEAGVGALFTGAVEAPFALKNADNELLGQIRAAGLYLMENGSSGLMQQLDLVSSNHPSGTQEPEHGQRL